MRKRDGLISIGEALSGLGGTVKAIREASLQTKTFSHFLIPSQLEFLQTSQQKTWGIASAAGQVKALCSSYAPLRPYG